MVTEMLHLMWEHVMCFHVSTLKQLHLPLSCGLGTPPALSSGAHELAVPLTQGAAERQQIREGACV